MTVFMCNEDMAPKEGLPNEKTTKSSESETDPANEVDIPGLKNVWGSKYTLIGKLIWMLIIISCTIVVLVQVINRLQFYMSMPVSVSVHVQNNQTMSYPDVTVCNTEYFDQNAYMEVRKEIANISGTNVSDVFIDNMLDYMNIMELWNRVSFRLEDIVSSCLVENKLCDYVGAWRPTITVLGICYTYSLHRPVNASGGLYGMNIILKSLARSSAWKILLNSPKDSPKAKVFLEGISISSNITMAIRIQLRQFLLKPSGSKPCMETQVNDCDVKCLSDLTLEKYHCRLPFMEDVDAPYCDSPYHTIADSTIKKVLTGQENGCACVPECNFDYYETKIDSTYIPDRNTTQVRIFYETFQFITIMEDFSYSFVALLSDIGGTLGLFLGFSILTVIGILESLVIKLKQSWKLKKAKEIVVPETEITSAKEKI